MPCQIWWPCCISAAVHIRLKCFLRHKMMHEIMSFENEKNYEFWKWKKNFVLWTEVFNVPKKLFILQSLNINGTTITVHEIQGTMHHVRIIKSSPDECEILSALLRSPYLGSSVEFWGFCPAALNSVPPNSCSLRHNHFLPHLHIIRHLWITYTYSNTYRVKQARSTC